MNREAWLTEAADRIVPLFRGINVAPFRVTCGWPSVNGLGARSRRIGECWYGHCSPDGVHQIFVSPVIDKPGEVAGVIAHELCHVVAGKDAGHGKGFVRFARHLGLCVRKPAQAMPLPHLQAELDKIVAAIGPYPHTALTVGRVPRPKKEPTAVTLVCGCGCKVRITSKFLSDPGPPTCGCGEQFSTNGGGGG